MENETMDSDKCKKCEASQKMMSKRKWIALLSVFIVYILLGGAYFYQVENREESINRQFEEGNRTVILEILRKLVNWSHHEADVLDLLDRLDGYCEKPIKEKNTKPLVWDYYHSVFFAITVLTTIGYGNLAPTTSLSRLFMIAYGLIGIPVNGILFTTLGDYFSKTFIRIYRRWKNNKVKNYAASLSLVTQIILYLIPGLIIFLVLPAFVIQHFEKWDYVLSIYYAFVTLTTIGFGDYVAGVYNNGHDEIYFIVYQLFLLIWIIFGLGYLVMVIKFLTRGLQSKRMARIEKHITQNLKSTHSKLWHGVVKDFTYLRRIMNELYMARFQPVYRDEYSSVTPPKIGSQSFPDLRKLIIGDMSPKTARRRAFSECISSRSLTRVQSDTDLHRIDKEATFASLGIVQPCDLLVNVASALTKTSFSEALSDSEEEGGIHGFSDSEILASEMYGSGWTLGSQDIPMQPPKTPRNRATSEIKIPISEELRQDNNNGDWTWFGPAATQKIQEIRQRTKFDRARTRTRENSQSNSSKSLFEKIKSTWSKSVDEHLDVEKQQTQPQQWENTVNSSRSGFSVEQERYLNRTRAGRASVFSVPESRVLEETSVADLLRALSSIHSRVSTSNDGLAEPRRKLGTASLTPPKIPSIIELFNPPAHMIQTSRHPPIRGAAMPRRASLAPTSTNPLNRRRFSLHPVSEDQLMIPPPPYSPTTSLPTPQSGNTRKPSLFQSVATSSPMSAPKNLVHKQVSRLRGPANARILYTRTRHNSLKDLNIERPTKFN